MEVFDKIYNKNIWRSKESRSGPGSTIKKTINIRESIPKLIIDYNIKSVFDCPCGDFNWMKEIINKIPNYIGGDVCKDLIENNKKKYNSKFVVFNLCEDKIFDCDLLIIRDCLFHLSNEDIFKVLENIKKSNIKFILTTNFKRKNNKDIVSGGWRPLSLCAPPFNLPKPIKILEENETRIYKDKHLGLWKKEQLF